MKNVGKVAKLLSEFDMKGVTSCTVNVYFRLKEHEQLRGSELSYPHQGGLDFLAWDEDQWEAYINGRCEVLRDLEPVSIDAIQVSFRLGDDSRAPSYCVEARDLSQGGRFNRVVFTNPPKADRYLTAKESEEMRGVLAVAEYSDSVSIMERRRRRMIGDDLPEAMTL